MRCASRAGVFWVAEAGGNSICGSDLAMQGMARRAGKNTPDNPYVRAAGESRPDQVATGNGSLLIAPAQLLKRLRVRTSLRMVRRA